MSPARLHIADAPFAPEFGKRGELRQPVGKSGRVHLDRWLPFIVLHRSPDPSTQHRPAGRGQQPRLSHLVARG